MKRKLGRKCFGESAEEDLSDEKVTDTSVSTIKPSSDWEGLSNLESSESEEDEIKDSEEDEDEPLPPTKKQKTQKEVAKLIDLVTVQLTPNIKP